MTLFTSGKIEIFFSGSWVDVTPWLTGGVSIQQGRANEWSQITPGIMTLSLKNPDGRFMPGLSTSPYYPNVIPEKQIRWTVTHAAVAYVRFWGYIKAIEPTFPGASTNHATVKISAVDNLGLAAGKKLYSSWAHTTRFNANSASAHYDAFITNSADGAAAGQLDNITDASGTAATAVVVFAATNVGELSFGAADSLSIEGSATFNPAASHLGSMIHVGPFAVGQSRGIAFWVKFPGSYQTTSGPAQRDVIALYTGGGATRIGELRLTLNATQDDLGFFNSARTFVAPAIYGNIADSRWHMISLLTKTATPTTTDLYVDGSLRLNVAMDLRNCTDLWFGGAPGSNQAQMEMAGIVMSASENGLPTAATQGLTAGAGGPMNSRINGLQAVLPVTLTSLTGGVYTQTTMTGNWHGRSCLDVMQEQMRGVSGFWWARSYDSRLVAVDSTHTYPGSPLITIDAEGHLLGTLELREGVESVPTRVVVEFPGGQVTVVDTAAETASRQIRPKTVTTIVDTVASATTLASALLANSSTRLRVSALTLDLETASTDTVAALFDSSSELPGLFPTQRIRMTLPSSHFNPSTVDAFVEGWTETFDGAGGCRITFDLSA
jgi:hypothetical protein